MSLKNKAVSFTLTIYNSFVFVLFIFLSFSSCCILLILTRHLVLLWYPLVLGFVYWEDGAVNLSLGNNLKPETKASVCVLSPWTFFWSSLYCFYKATETRLSTLYHYKSTFYFASFISLFFPFFFFPFVFKFSLSIPVRLYRYYSLAINWKLPFFFSFIITQTVSSWYKNIFIYFLFKQYTWFFFYLHGEFINYFYYLR